MFLGKFIVFLTRFFKRKILQRSFITNYIDNIHKIREVKRRTRGDKEKIKR